MAGAGRKGALELSADVMISLNVASMGDVGVRLKHYLQAALAHMVETGSGFRTS